MKNVLAWTTLVVALATAQSVVGANDIDDAALQALIDNGEAKQVVSRMESRLKNGPETAEAHYWLATGQLAQVDAASTFRKLGLARNGKKHLLAALELDPAHVEARNSLGQYYLQAPAIAGGSKKQARAQADALMKLDKAAALRLKADIEWQEENVEAAIAYDRQALAAGTWVWAQQYTLVIQGVHNQLPVAEAVLDEAEQNVRRHTPEDVRALRLIDYQRGKFAAVSGQALEAGRAGLKRYLDYDPSPEDPDSGWAEFRLAQVERRLGEAAAAEARLSRLEAGEVPEDLGFALQDERRWHYAD
ncbi:MAG: hypothetical protein AAF358_05560 [Pseudomonadota bacterium]